mgnify:CR=1 FL=1
MQSVHQPKARIGHFVSRVDGIINLGIFFDELRLERSKRPLRLLRLLRSLRPLRFLIPGKSLSSEEHALFYYQRPKRPLRSLRSVMLSCLLGS